MRPNMAETQKFSNDMASRASVAGTRRLLVPLLAVLEESGRFGEHALRLLLREIAIYRGVDDGSLMMVFSSPPPLSLAFFQKARLLLTGST